MKQPDKNGQRAEVEKGIRELCEKNKLKLVPRAQVLPDGLFSRAIFATFGRFLKVRATTYIFLEDV